MLTMLLKALLPAMTLLCVTGCSTTGDVEPSDPPYTPWWAEEAQ